MRYFGTRAEELGIDTSKPPSQRYQILGRIAAGGMGEIYLARMALRSGVWREVVLKRLPQAFQGDSECVQMFYDEARIAAMLEHPNIAEIYELGESKNSLFMSMELIRGANLKEIQDRLREVRGSIPLPFVLRVALGALDALEFAHEFQDREGRRMNIIHRDVSPQNIIVTYQGDIKLVDFGVAKAEGRMQRTTQGLIKGKVAYMSPEQLCGFAVDARSDLFALGEVIYELALKRHPFQSDPNADVGQIVYELLEGQVEDPGTIDPKFPLGLSAILVRALSKDPADRFPDARTMRAVMEAHIHARTPASSPEALGKFVRDLFADRLKLEDQARSTKNDALLVEALCVGGRTRSDGPFTPAKGSKAVSPAKGPSMAALPIQQFVAQPTLLLTGGQRPADQDHDQDEDENDGAGEFGDRSSIEEIEAKTIIAIEGKAIDVPPPLNEFEDETTLSLNRPEASKKPIWIGEVGEVGTTTLNDTMPGPQESMSAAPPDLSGHRIGDYLLEQRLGIGPLAEVYVAKQTNAHGFEKRVSLKWFFPHLTRGGEFLDAFIEEAKAGARHTHPNIAPVIDLQLVQGRLMVTADYVRGWSLATLLQECKKQRRELPLPIACRMMSEVLAALVAAHTPMPDGEDSDWFVHGDLKPDNILVSSLGAVKVTDFGIAKAAVTISSTISSNGRSRPAYIAPEQLTESKHNDVRSDVFSAGAVFYEMLSLAPMFHRESPLATLLAIQAGQRTPLSAIRRDVPRVLEIMVERATAQWIGDRYSSASLFQHDLERYLAKHLEPVTSSSIAAWLQLTFPHMKSGPNGVSNPRVPVEFPRAINS